MSSQQVVNASVKLFEALDRKDKLLRELEQLDQTIALCRGFVEGNNAAVLAARAPTEARESSPTPEDDTVAQDKADDQG